MSLRRRAGGLAVAAMLLVLVGCAAVPQSGPVQTAAPSRVADDPNLVFSPVEPRNGDSPEEIVQGFVLAAVAGGDFTVARKYLTAQASKDWNPAEQVLVHQQAWSVTATGTGKVRLSVPAVASVNATGQYRQLPGHRVPLDFQLTQIGGQWRISAPPSGIVLAQNVFNGFAQPVALRFFEPGFTRVVPDVRWFPARGDESTAIVQALLAGPAAPLQSPVTASAFPVGTLLDGDVVQSGGTTTVRLRVPGGGVDQRTAERIQQQLALSLPKATSAIRLIVDGRVQPVAQPLTVQSSSGQDPSVLAGGRFGTLSGGSFTADGALGRRIASTKPTAVTVSVRQDLAAVLAGSGVAAVTASGVKTLDSRQGLVAPTLDQRGWIYSVPQDDPTGLTAFRSDGRPVSLGGVLNGTAVTSIEASPDGTRLLVVTESGSGPKAYVAGIERRADGTPERLTPASFPVDADAEQVVDGTWYDSTRVAVLTGGTDSQSVVVQTLAGLSTRLGGLTGAVALSGPTGGGGVLALLDGGAIYQHPGSLWEARPSGSVQVQVLAVQR